MGLHAALLAALLGGRRVPPPVNLVAPVASVPVVAPGETAASTTGTWSGAPAAYAYQWKRGGVAIGGATANTYVLVAADIGPSITCDVTATGAAAAATSNALVFAWTQTWDAGTFEMTDADHVTSGGGTVSAADDQSALNRDMVEATGAKQPALVASDALFGGHAVINSDDAGHAKGLQSNGGVANYKELSDGTGCGLLFVGNCRGPQGNSLVSTGHSAGPQFTGMTLTLWTSNNLRASVGNSVDGVPIVDCVTTSGTFLPAAGHVVIVTYRSGTNPDMVVYIDRVQVGTASETGTPDAGNPFGPLSFGYSAGTKAGGADGSMRRLGMWRDTPSARDIATAHAAVAYYDGV